MYIIYVYNINLNKKLPLPGESEICKFVKFVLL